MSKIPHLLLTALQNHKPETVITNIHIALDFQLTVKKKNNLKSVH